MATSEATNTADDVKGFDKATDDDRFEIIESSQRGRCKLYERVGYSYNISRKHEKYTIWRCSVRNAKVKCKATVKQIRDAFTPGPQVHAHPPQLGGAVAAQISKDIKELAKQDIFSSAAKLTKAALDIHLGAEPCPAPLKIPCLQRKTNYARQRRRPVEPQDMDFVLQKQHIPEDFLQADIKVDGKRHIVLATSQQLDLLHNAKAWYVDGTSKVVRKPFMQLWSLHAFVRDGDESKQVPLVFCLMTSRKKADYKVVMRAVLDLLPGEPAVQEVVMDFEKAAWRAFASVLPEVHIRGCSFHWGQAVYMKTQELGLRPAYMQNHRRTRKLVKRLLGLSLLPAEHIAPAFDKLAEKAGEGAIEELMVYIKKNWIESTVWPPAHWSGFGLAVRTNNDVEGWHTRLRFRGKASMPFYHLVDVLHKEAESIPMSIRLLSDGKLYRMQRKRFQQREGKLVLLWDRYRAGELTAMNLLKSVAGINEGPV